MLPIIPKSELLAALRVFVQLADDNPGNWFVGVNDEPDLTVPEKRRIGRRIDQVLVGRVRSNKEARTIRDHLVSSLGVNSGGQGSRDDCTFIYAYRVKG